MDEQAIRWTPHARRAARRRNLPLDVVRRVAERPEQVVRSGPLREVRQSVVAFGVDATPYLVRVVVESTPAGLVVVTVYRTSRIAKYRSLG